MTAAPKLRFTFQEYLLVDESSQARHEFVEGLILGMAGGTPEHARLAVAVAAALSEQLRGKRCAVFSEALRVRGLETGFAGYPDLTVVCGDMDRDPENSSTVVNPTVVVEILSPSTEEYDRGTKLEHYRRISSLKHVVLVAHDQVQIEVWSRAEGAWSSRSYTADGRAELPAIGCVLDVNAIFRDPLS